MAMHPLPYGENMHGQPIWLVRDKKTDFARVVLNDEGLYDLYWVDKWASINRNQTFDALDEAVQWVVTEVARRREKANPKVVKGKPIRLGPR